MTIPAEMPGLVSLTMSLCDVCLAVAFVGCIFTLVEAGFVLAFSDEQPASAGVPPPAMP